MLQQLRQEYDTTCEMLDELRSSKIIREVFASDKGTDDIDEDIFFYRYQRVLIGLRRLKHGDTGYRDEFGSDYDDFGQIFYELCVDKHGGSSNTHSYAIDFLTFGTGNTQADILSALPPSNPNEYYADSPCGGGIVYAARLVALKLLSQNRQPEATALLKDMLVYSEAHRHGNNEYHINVAMYLLEPLDPYPQVGRDLCETIGQFYATHPQAPNYDSYLWFKQVFAARLGDSETAEDVLLDCIELREKLYGLEDWFTVLPTARYYMFYVVIKPEYDIAALDTYELDYVEQFIRDTSNNVYQNWDNPAVKQLVGSFAGCVLRHVYMSRDCLHHHTEFLPLFVELCHEFDADPAVPDLKVRIAKHVEAAYLLQSGDLIRAARLFKEALNTELPAGTVWMIPPENDKYNLCHTYYLQGDLGSAIPLCNELLQELDPDDPEQEDVWLRVFGTKIGILCQTNSYTEEDVQEVIDTVHSMYDEVCSLMDGEYLIAPEPLSLLTLDAITFLISNKIIEISTPLLNECRTVLEYMLGSPTGFIHRETAFAVMYEVMALIQWRANDPSAVTYACKTAEIVRSLTHSPSMRLSALRTCAIVMYAFGGWEAVKATVDELTGMITSYWHNSVKYFNDQRMEHFLTPAQIACMSICVMMSNHCSDVEVFEHILHFKSLASLAGRERNRFLCTHRGNEDLIAQIKQLQDRLAVSMTSSISQSNDLRISELKEKIEELEAEFSEQMPTELDFVDISYQQVAEAIPDDCAVIEYYVFYVPQDDPIIIRNSKVTPSQIEIALITKKAGEVRLTRKSIKGCAQLLDDAQRLVDTFRRESLEPSNPDYITPDDINFRDVALHDLYKQLIQPFESRITQFDQLYIAPDQELTAVPFELLRPTTDPKDTLADHYHITRLDSSRDFLFSFDDIPKGHNSLIIGNPKYDINEDRSQTTDRLSTLRAESVKQLPLSELEAAKIGMICNTPCIVGKEAIKTVLLDARKCGIIHIATHGFFDRELEQDAVYSSFLLFAGAKNWMSSGIEDPVYGNGIVTADEISRLDLRSVDLVVLSACFSGMTDQVITQNLKGLVGGFAAAGVKYVVTQLWSANDTATEVLMEYFYDGYINRNLPPADALQLAKKRLREITVADLEQMGIIQYGIEHTDIGSKSHKAFENLRRKSPMTKPYADEFYWGGFSCHQCHR